MLGLKETEQNFQNRPERTLRQALRSGGTVSTAVKLSRIKAMGIKGREKARTRVEETNGSRKSLRASYHIFNHNMKIIIKEKLFKIRKSALNRIF